MNADKRLTSAMIVAMSLFLVSIAYGSDSKKEPATGALSSKEPGIHEEPSTKDSDGKPGEAGGLLHGTLHVVVMEERTKVISEIDKQRKATLAYLTEERLAVMGELDKELTRVSDLLQSERQATMVEMEAIGYRIVENAILKGEGLIDHFFIRAVQMVSIIIIVAGIFGFILFRMAAKRKSTPL